MRPDPVWMPPRTGTRQTEMFGPLFIAQCLAMFYRGMDTKSIAVALMEREHVVAWAVRVGREAAMAA